MPLNTPALNNVLRNDDILKMAAAKLDDATIVAKIMVLAAMMAIPEKTQSHH